jgi:hypothetical protein
MHSCVKTNPGDGHIETMAESIANGAGGTPYGASTIAGGDGCRQPDGREKAIARYQGKYVAGIMARMNMS